MKKCTGDGSASREKRELCRTNQVHPNYSFNSGVARSIRVNIFPERHERDEDDEQCKARVNDTIKQRHSDELARAFGSCGFTVAAQPSMSQIRFCFKFVCRVRKTSCLSFESTAAQHLCPRSGLVLTAGSLQFQISSPGLISVPKPVSLAFSFLTFSCNRVSCSKYISSYLGTNLVDLAFFTSNI